MPTDHTERLARNRQSKEIAERDGEEWTEEQVAFLFEMWKVEPLEDIAAVLGRTIEACREKYHKTVREGLTMGRSRTARSDQPYRGFLIGMDEGWD